MSDLSRIGVAIDSELLEKFDELIAKRGYTNRSEAFRDLIRDELVQKSWESPDSHVVGTVTLVYDHHVRMLSEKLTDMQHDFHRFILSTLHVHLDHDNCLEVLVVRGKAGVVQKIRRYADQHQRRQTRPPHAHHLRGGVEMILGTGVDLAEVARIRAAVERYGQRFIGRIYTPGEIAYVERKANRFERYAGRFAAKEAGMKAIGTGWKRGVRWQDFEVANLPSRPADAAPPRRSGQDRRAAGREIRPAFHHPHRRIGHGSRDPGGLR